MKECWCCVAWLGFRWLGLDFAAWLSLNFCCLAWKWFCCLAWLELNAFVWVRLGKWITSLELFVVSRLIRRFCWSELRHLNVQDLIFSWWLLHWSERGWGLLRPKPRARLSSSFYLFLKITSYYDRHLGGACVNIWRCSCAQLPNKIDFNYKSRGGTREITDSLSNGKKIKIFMNEKRKYNYVATHDATLPSFRWLI